MKEKRDFSGLISAIPWVVLVIGISLFWYGTYGTFEDLTNKEFASGLGKTILASGIFALLLKTVQFMGVFKNELSKVVYDAKFLENRKDLETVWEDVSRVMFKNKFQKISKRLLKDITGTYFPTSHAVYIDDLEHFISIEYTNEENNDVLINYMVSLNFVCSSSKDKCSYDFSNVATFKNESEPELSIEIKSIKVDDEPQTCEHKVLTEGKQLINSFTLPLHGKEKYKIERHEIRKYKLDNDNIFYFRAIKITNNLKVILKHPTDLAIEFRKCGTISDFSLKRDTNDYKEWYYDGLLYPQQGYIITLNKK